MASHLNLLLTGQLWDLPSQKPALTLTCLCRLFRSPGYCNFLAAGLGIGTYMHADFELLHAALDTQVRLSGTGTVTVSPLTNDTVHDVVVKSDYRQIEGFVKTFVVLYFRTAK